jgi:transcriptional regulator with XRE-family HTH domain
VDHCWEGFNLSKRNEGLVQQAMNRKELNPDASPQAAFGARLRSLREARGWTQDDLAERTEYSAVHISAIETGRKPPTLRFSRNVDVALGIQDRGAETFEYEYRQLRQGSMLEGFPEYVGHEGRAAEIRLFEIGIIPGLLQTPEYARVLAESAVKRGAITPEQAQERVELVAARQAALVRPTLPTVFVMLDESCVRRPIGEPAVMKAQLTRLVEFAEQPNTVLQVAPYDMGARRTFDLPLYILTMSDRSLMSYAESAHRGQLERESSFVLPLLSAYHQLQAEACSQAASVAMIEQLRKGTS